MGIGVNGTGLERRSTGEAVLPYCVEIETGASSHWAAQVVERSPSAVIVFDADDLVVYANAAAGALLELPPAGLEGAAIRDLVEAEDWTAQGRATAATAFPGDDHDADGVEVELTVVEATADPPLRAAFLHRPAKEIAELERVLEVMDDGEALASMGNWRFSLTSRAAKWSDELSRIHGLKPAAEDPDLESWLSMIHPDDRHVVGEQIDAMIADPGTGQDVGIAAEYRIMLPDGSAREMLYRGRIERGDDGEPAYWVGSAQDVTRQRVTERELYARYAVTLALREWVSFEEGAVGLLRRLGTALDFPLGSLWTWREDTQEVGCRASWSAVDVDPAEFSLAMRDLSYALGAGAPGRAWGSRRPVIIPDLSTEPEYAHAAFVSHLGLTSGLAFPAIGPDGPVAVLCFYGTDRREPSPRLLRTLIGIGDELGRFLARRREPLEVRAPSKRELEVLRLAAEGNSGPQIAELLVLAPSTIKTHFENIYEKLGVSDRPAAVAYALRTGLID